LSGSKTLNLISGLIFFFWRVVKS